MAITYPISTPTSIGMESISISAHTARVVSQSPFTGEQQVLVYDKQMWEASVSIPPVHRDLAEPWVSFLMKASLSDGTFLLGDPNGEEVRGTATSGTITGSIADNSVTVAMTGTLLEGDWFQLGSGSSATLHKVLEDQDGNGTLEIFPALRVAHTTTAMVLSSPKGVFRLSSPVNQYQINNTGAYGIKFDAMEVL